VGDKHKPRRIERLYAWICTEPDGGHGIPALKMPDDVIMPMIGSDLIRIESLRPYAEDIRMNKGYPMELVEFSGRKVLETLE